MRPNARKYDELAEFTLDIVKKAYEEGMMNGPMLIFAVGFINKQKS